MIEYYLRVTSENITELKENEIFVFGSNEAGRHGKGAAKTALKFGAIYGRGKGQNGNTYAIPTMNYSITKSVPMNKLEKCIRDFIKYTKKHPQYTYLVTKIGCGLAGLKVKDIAPLFEEAFNIDNIYLPQEFWRIIMHNIYEKEDESANTEHFKVMNIVTHQTKPGRVLKRKIHFYDELFDKTEIWSWNTNGGSIYIQNPENTIKCKINSTDFFDCSYEYLERASWKGYGDRFSVKPHQIKKIIELRLKGI